MMALYNGDSSTAAGADAAGANVAGGGGGDDVGEGPAGRDQHSSKKKGGMDAELEEFMVQQVRRSVSCWERPQGGEGLARPFI